MALVNFSNLDFDQVKTTLKDYLQSNSNFTDYDFEGSNLSTIIDVLAYNTYITSYNANMVANEVFIDSATLRENVVALARNIGYVPRSRKAAKATVSFYVDTTNVTPVPVTLTIRKGPVAATTGGFGGQSFIFSILEDITVPVVDNIANFNDITVYEGTLLQSNYEFSSRNKNQKFVLQNSGIDTELISVGVKPTRNASASTSYKLHDNIFDIDSSSKVYYLQEISDERYEIFFGDGIFGQSLEDRNYITVDYIITNGEEANGIIAFNFAGKLIHTHSGVEYPITSGISLLSTGLQSSGGETIESVESVRKFAPKIYATQNRAVTSQDYESLIPSKIYPETESISVFGGEELVPPQYGKVFISIKPRTGDFLPNIIKENIKMKLKKYAVAGIVPEILDLKYLYIEVFSKIYYNSNLAQTGTEVSSLVQNAATKYAESTELNRYGARFKYSKFLNIVDQSQEGITSNITTVQMRRDLRVILNKVTEYSIGFGNAFHIKNMSGFNVKSSQFMVDGFADPVYISDIPNSSGATGSLFLFTLPNVNSTSPRIVKRNVGRINYLTGVISIHPIIVRSGKIRDGQSIIENWIDKNSNFTWKTHLFNTFLSILTLF